MDDSGLAQKRIAERAGLGASTLCRWRTGKIAPTVGMVEAALGAIGYRLAVVPTNDSTERTKT